MPSLHRHRRRWSGYPSAASARPCRPRSRRRPSCFTSASILAIASSPMPNCLQPLAIDLDRVALLPALELALGAILGRVGARMAAVAIGQALDQRRPVAGARLVEGRLRGAIDHVGVVAVDHDLLQPVGRGAVAGRMLAPPSRRRSACIPCRGCSRRRRSPAASRPRRNSAPRGTRRYWWCRRRRSRPMTSLSPLYCARQAAPQAIGRCAPMMA